jgi:hypothetical protein
MRPRHYKWIAAGAALYLFIMWSGYRWSKTQWPTDGNLFEKMNRDGYARLAKERAQAAQAVQPQDQLTPAPAAEFRLNAAGPAYVAARYDATHVVFIVTNDTASRFSNSPLSRFASTPTKISAPAQPAAPLAGLEELWEPDPHSLHFLPTIIQQTQPGDQWMLSLAADQTIPVKIERPVIAPTGCSLALGFLAEIPPEQQSTFAASSREYFAVRRATVESADPPLATQVSELANWKPTPGLKKQIEQQLTARMTEDLARIDGRLRSNAGSPGATADEYPVANPYPHLKEWLRADRGLSRGEGVLDYDIHAYRITPDQVPRLFVRARWKLASSPVFLMTAWFKDAPPVIAKPNATPATPASIALPALLSADSTWSLAMREGEAPATLGDDLNFQTILNQFDADRDGWAELLIYSYDVQSHDTHTPSDQLPTQSTTIALYLYTDKGLVPMKMPFRRDAHPPESCLQQ